MRVHPHLLPLFVSAMALVCAACTETVDDQIECDGPEECSCEAGETPVCEGVVGDMPGFCACIPDGTGGNGGTGDTSGSGGMVGTGGTAGSGGTGGQVAGVCGAGTACTGDENAGVWCADNVCAGVEDVEFGFCNNELGNPNADDQFVCECLSGVCSRGVDCVETSECDYGLPTEAFCENDCLTACGSADNIRWAFCPLFQIDPDKGFCECVCKDAGVVSCGNVL